MKNDTKIIFNISDDHTKITAKINDFDNIICKVIPIKDDMMDIEDNKITYEEMISEQYDFMPYVYAIFICNNYIDDGQFYKLEHTKYKIILYEKIDNNLKYFLDNILYYKNNFPIDYFPISKVSSIRICETNSGT